MIVVSVNVLDARNNLSKLVAAAGDGEDVVISKRGRPLVRLVRIEEETVPHTGRAIAEWLTCNHPPTYSGRTAAELADQIRDERDSWE